MYQGWIHPLTLLLPHSHLSLDSRLNEFGYRVGLRALELVMLREKNPRRETRILGILYFINASIWKALFGRQADSLEKSTENDDECMHLPPPPFPLLLVYMVIIPSLISPPLPPFS